MGPDGICPLRQREGRARMAGARSRAWQGFTAHGAAAPRARADRRRRAVAGVCGGAAHALQPGWVGPGHDLGDRSHRHAVAARGVRSDLLAVGVPVPAGPGSAPAEARRRAQTWRRARHRGLLPRHAAPHPRAPALGELPQGRPGVLRVTGRRRQYRRAPARVVRTRRPRGRRRDAGHQVRPGRIASVELGVRLLHGRPAAAREVSALHPGAGVGAPSRMARRRETADLVAHCADGGGRRRAQTKTIYAPTMTLLFRLLYFSTLNFEL